MYYLPTYLPTYTLPIQTKAHFTKSFKVPDTPESRQILEMVEDLARKDGWSVSELIRVAIAEYVERHSPGNPQLALGHWTQGLALPKTLSGHPHVWLQNGTADGTVWTCARKECWELWWQPLS